MYLARQAVVLPSISPVHRVWTGVAEDGEISRMARRRFHTPCGLPSCSFRDATSPSMSVQRTFLIGCWKSRFMSMVPGHGSWKCSGWIQRTLECRASGLAGTQSCGMLQGSILEDLTRSLSTCSSVCQSCTEKCFFMQGPTSRAMPQRHVLKTCRLIRMNGDRDARTSAPPQTISAT